MTKIIPTGDLPPTPIEPGLKPHHKMHTDSYIGPPELIQAWYKDQYKPMDFNEQEARIEESQNFDEEFGGPIPVKIVPKGYIKNHK